MKGTGKYMYESSTRQKYSAPSTRRRGRALINPRTAGGGGADDRPPPENSKTKKIATSGKRIGRGKFYQKYLDHFLIWSNLRSQGSKKVKFSQNRAIFAENRNYLNNYTSQQDCKIAKW